MQGRRRRKEGEGKIVIAVALARRMSHLGSYGSYPLERGTAEKCVSVCVTGPKEEDGREGSNSSIHLHIYPFKFDITRDRS